MLPFAIISTYGNTEDKIIIKKYIKGATYTAAIDSKNNLWYLGYNGYGGAGDGTTSTDYFNFKLIRSDVLNFWSSGIYGTTVIRTLDGKFWWCGSDSWLTGVWPGKPNTTWTEIPFLSSKDVKYLQMGSDYIIALIGTKLYAIGKNSSGIFNGTSLVPNGGILSSWTLISSNYDVVDFSTTNTGQAYMTTTTGSTMACGINASNSISVSSGTSTIFVWTAILNTGKLSNTLSYQYRAGFTGNITVNSSMVYARGSGGGYQFGNGSTSTFSSATQITTWPNKAQINTLSYAGSEASSPQGGFYIAGSTIYGMGTQTYGELGTGDGAVKTTPVQVPFVLDAGEKLLAIVQGNLNCNTVYTTKRAWSAGRFFNGTAYTNILTFSPHSYVPNNWIFEFDENVRPWY